MKFKLPNFIIPLVALAGLVSAFIFRFENHLTEYDLILFATLIVGTIPLAYKIIRDILNGHFGVDLIAIVAILVAFYLHQYLAGSVIVLMLSGGEALEDYALKRSSRELTRLLSRAPTIGHIKINERIQDVPVEQIKIGQIFLVKPGEIIPVDGSVSVGNSEVDESSITGESRLVEKSPGSLVFSGAINKNSVLEVMAQKQAAESQYQRIVALVKEAQEKRAPLVRLADRYAVWFTAVTFVIAFAAWFFSGDALRFLSVLVVATPCPLILATPIAIISGISKSASRGIIIKNGGALETLGEAKAMVFDKTGTLTLGEPKVLDVVSDSNFPKEKVLSIAASLDQLSVHALARALVKYSHANHFGNLSIPQNLNETLGSGVQGTLNGEVYIFGKLSFIKDRGLDTKKEESAHTELQAQGKIAVYLANKNAILGYVIFADIARPEMKRVFREISEHKLNEVYMLTGDKTAVAQKIASDLGIKNFRAELLPEDKVREVQNIRKTWHPLAMVGDGINDAPALAAADVGIALAAHGSSAASESADIVIMQNNLMRVHDAVHIAQSVMRIAKQSIFAGIGISILLMFIAAAGHIPPVYGAILQEVIDVAVILNALRVNFEKVI